MGRVHLTLTFPAYELKQLVILLKKKKKIIFVLVMKRSGQLEKNLVTTL